MRLETGSAAIRDTAFHFRRSSSAVCPEIFQIASVAQITNRVGHGSSQKVVLQQVLVQEGHLAHSNLRNLSSELVATHIKIPEALCVTIISRDHSTEAVIIQVKIGENWELKQTGGNTADETIVRKIRKVQLAERFKGITNGSREPVVVQDQCLFLYAKDKQEKDEVTKQTTNSLS